MMRFWAVIGSACLVMSSLMVILTIFLLAEVRSLLSWCKKSGPKVAKLLLS